MSDYESVVITDDRDDHSNRKSDCIITFGDIRMLGTNKDGSPISVDVGIYKRLDANPKHMQSLMRSFYHWMEDEQVKWIDYKMDSDQLLVNLIYWIKRHEEEQDYSWSPSGKTETRHTTKGEWQTNHNVKNYMAFTMPKLASRDVQYIYKIDPDTQMMEILEGHWNSDTKKFEKHESIGTIPIGQNYDGTEKIGVN